MFRSVQRGTHSISKVFRSRKILIVDGDQNKVGNGQRDHLLSKYGEIHVFRNKTNEEVQRRQDVDATFCNYHLAPVSEKEAVDHAITFYCGQHSARWRRDKVDVTILSNDKTFRNTKALLESEGVSCTIQPSLLNQFSRRMLVKRS